MKHIAGTFVYAIGIIIVVLLVPIIISFMVENFLIGIILIVLVLIFIMAHNFNKHIPIFKSKV